VFDRALVAEELKALTELGKAPASLTKQP
jgi:hypothetical protein